MKNSNYKVYIHINKINDKKYVGLTKQNVKDRWKSGSPYKRSVIFYNAIQKYGWDNFEHLLLYDNLTKEEAEQKEMELITQYETLYNQHGYNVEKGGNANKEITEITRKRQSINNGRYWKGKHLPQEIKDKISKSKKGQRFGNTLLMIKKVKMFDLNNIFIKEYESISQAAKENNIPYQNISMCCRKIIHKTHGYKFEFSNQGQ